MIALLLIDMQEAFTSASWGPRNNPDAEKQALKILEAFRHKAWPVLHVQHVSENPSSLFSVGQGQAFQKGFEPLTDEPVFQKAVNSAFIGTNLQTYLKNHGIDHLVIAGLTLPHCVSTTTRMAANLGFFVSLLADATASFSLPDRQGELIPADLIHEINLASLDGEFAQVRETDEFLENINRLKKP